MANLKDLDCYSCGDSVAVDLDTDRVLCGRCVMGVVNRQVRLDSEKQENAVICDKHPRYRRRQAPRSQCKACWDAWRSAA